MNDIILFGEFPVVGPKHSSEIWGRYGCAGYRFGPRWEVLWDGNGWGATVGDGDKGRGFCFLVGEGHRDGSGTSYAR